MSRWARFITFSLSFAMTATLSATLFIIGDDADLVHQADAIVVASALTSYTQIGAYGGVETVTSLSVEQTIKGSAGDSIDVHEPGGRLGDQVKVVPGMPRFAVGERTLVFLRKTPKGNWVVLNAALGKFTFESDRVGQKLLVRAEGDVTGWTPEGEVYREQRRNAAKFLDFVRQTVNSGSAPHDYTVTYHPLNAQTNLLTPQTNTASTSPTSYTTPQNLPTDTFGSRWFTFPSPVTFYRNNPTNAADMTLADNAVNAGMGAWNNDCGSNVNLVNGGLDPLSHTNGLAGAADGTSSILFDRSMVPFGGAASYSCAANTTTIFGQGGINNLAATQVGPAGETFWTITEADVELIAGFLDCPAHIPTGDVYSGVAHELGHAIGFRHSDENRLDRSACTPSSTNECSSSAIMRANVPTGLNAALTTWDTNAVRSVYPANSCNAKGDFNGDLKPDIVLRNYTTGQNALWLMNGTTLTSITDLPALPNVNFHIEGTADFDGDGKTDIVLRNYSTGQDALWIMNGTSLSSIVDLPALTNTAYHFEGTGDFNGDGKADIILRNYTTGQNALWVMNGTSLTTIVDLPALTNTNWKIESSGDFNGDGKADIVLRNYATGQNAVWLMNGTSLMTIVDLPALTNLNYRIDGVADFNGDGMPDIVLRNYSTGQNAVWLMNGTSVTGIVDLPALPNTSYEINGPR